MPQDTAYTKGYSRGQQDTARYARIDQCTTVYSNTWQDAAGCKRIKYITANKARQVGYSRIQ
jgi:hypothetical protein